MWYYWPALMRRYIQLYKGQLARKLSISRNILGDKADAGQDFPPLALAGRGWASRNNSFAPIARFRGRIFTGANPSTV